MSEKTYTIKAKFDIDQADFDRTMEQINRKQKGMYSPSEAIRNQEAMRQQMQMAGKSNQAGMPGGSAPSAADFARVSQAARRDMDQALGVQIKGQEQIGKLLSSQEATLKQMKSHRDNSIIGSEKELEIRKKILDLEERTAKASSTYTSNANQINKNIRLRDDLEAASRMPTRGSFRGQAAGAPIPPPLPQPSNINIPGALMGASGAALAGIAAFNHLGGYSQRSEAAGASYSSDTSGRDLNNVYSGRSAFEQFYMPQREKASGMASKKRWFNEKGDLLKGLLGTGMSFAGAGLMGVGAFGTASVVGAPVGLPMFATGAAVAGIGGALLSNDRNRTAMLGTDHPAYQKLIKAEESKDFVDNYQNLKDQDQETKQVMERYEKNLHRDLSSQRTLGLNDKQFYKEGGLLRRSAGEGFSDDQAIGMGNSIVAAGGSSRMGGQAEFGLQMERSGLTNAAGMLGKMSHSIENPESVKRAAISGMAEAVKIGFDNTKFAEENRKFNEAVSTIIGRTGVTNVADQDRASSDFGRFVTEKTNRGVENAVSVNEQFQQRGSQTDGRRGAMRFADSYKDKNLSQLEVPEQVLVQEMRPEDMNDNNPIAASLAKKAGFKNVNEMKDRTGKISSDNRFLDPVAREKFEKSRKKIQEYMDKNNKSFSQVYEEFDKKTLDPGIANELGNGGAQISIDSGERESPSTIKTKMGEFFTNPGDKDLLKKEILKTEARGKLDDKGDKISDRVLGAAAEGANQATIAFDKLSASLMRAAKAAGGSNQFNDTVIDNAGVAGANAAANRATLPTGSGVLGPSLQVHAGKLSPSKTGN